MAISAAELAIMRETISSLLPDTCNILTVTETANGAGGVSQSWGTAYTSVACRLDKRTGNEQLSAGAIQPFTGWVLSLPYNATISEACRVEHGGYTYNVTSVNNDASWRVVKRAILERVV